MNIIKTGSNLATCFILRLNELMGKIDILYMHDLNLQYLKNFFMIIFSIKVMNK